MNPLNINLSLKKLNDRKIMQEKSLSEFLCRAAKQNFVKICHKQDMGQSELSLQLAVCTFLRLLNSVAYLVYWGENFRMLYGLLFFVFAV